MQHNTFRGSAGGLNGLPSRVGEGFLRLVALGHPLMLRCVATDFAAFYEIQSVSGAALSNRMQATPTGAPISCRTRRVGHS